MTNKGHGEERQTENMFPSIIYAIRRLLLICALLTIPSFDRFHDMVPINIKYTQCILWSLYCLLLQNHPSMDPEPWRKNNVVINRWSIYQCMELLAKLRCMPVSQEMYHGKNEKSYPMLQTD